MLPLYWAHYEARCSVGRLPRRRIETWYQSRVGIIDEQKSWAATHMAQWRYNDRRFSVGNAKKNSQGSTQSPPIPSTFPLGVVPGGPPGQPPAWTITTWSALLENYPQTSQPIHCAGHQICVQLRRYLTAILVYVESRTVGELGLRKAECAGLTAESNNKCQGSK